ncbi:MAG TPA: hybrid sensor histidine kinase/response regulator [bacterium]|nr:hybrid sensor histidine kinase/response regulator [bacterium]HNB55903.1 hybrid sensor histidine kinase/response regulator [bacterium]
MSVATVASPSMTEPNKIMHDILVVDDEVDNLDLLKRTFRREYNVYSANSAAEALKLLDEREFAVIVSDQRMPEMTGVEMFQKAREKYPQTIRILLTGYTDINALVDAINMGHVYRYVTKPWSREEIVMTVKRAVEHYETTKQNARLLDELKIKNEELDRNNKQLKRLDELKTRFMVISSHELRTPASIISGNLELLMSGAMGEVPPEHQEIVTNAYKGTTRLIDLIEDVLSVMRSDSHNLKLNLSAYSPREVLEEVISSYRAFLHERRQTVQNELPELTIEGDRDRMFHVFANALSNAMKYSRDGETIGVSGKLNGDYMRITFRDAGIGIPPEELERIFEKFYQLGDADQHRTSKHKFMGGGSGLGLTIVRGIVEEHHGRVWAESEGKDKGAALQIELPLQQPVAG